MAVPMILSVIVPNMGTTTKFNAEASNATTSANTRNRLFLTRCGFWGGAVFFFFFGFGD